MTKQAHITSRPDMQVGDKAIALCDKEFKVKVLWEHLPNDKPICRDCVDVALNAMTEADEVVRTARRFVDRIASLTMGAIGVLEPDDGGLILDGITERADEFEDRQNEKRNAKALELRAQSTCTCTWTDKNAMTVDPECPIHGDDYEPPEGGDE